MFDQDPQRVCILQGPVAVRHCTSTQIPIATMLGDIQDELVERVLADYYGGDATQVPDIDYLAPQPKPVDPVSFAAEHDVAHAVEDLADGAKKHVFSINGVLPPTGEWLAALAGPKLGWLQAFLSNVSIQAGEASVPNPVKRVLAPRHGQRVELTLRADGQPLKLDVFSAIQ